MKDKQLQTKRQTKKGLRKLHAKVTSSSRRKQRVSAAANPDMLDSDVPNASIGRALTVILLLHVVAITAVYIGVQWNKGKVDLDTVSVPAASGKVDLSNVNASLPTDFVLAGDTYASFAQRHNVDESELRNVNGNATIHAGKPLSIPPKKITIAAQASTAELPVSDRPALPATNTVVQVPAVDATPVLVKPKIAKAEVVAMASGKTYQVKQGDSIWRISRKYKVNQDALMKLNGMKDAGRLRAGMTLKIPSQ